MTISWIFLIIAMTMIGALGGLFFKRASVNGISISKVFIFNLMLGGVFYLCSALLNVIVLKHLRYTVVFPLTSITYIWTLVISSIFLKEKITLSKAIGVLLIFIGSFLLVS